MKKATLSALIGMIFFSLLAAGPAFTQTSTPPAESKFDSKPEAKADKKLNQDLDAGKTCLDYTLAVVSLVDNDHRIFWKPSDCIRVHITNNPFLFKYSLQFNEQLIKEDDPLSAFGGKFGLDVSNVSNPSGGATSHSTSADLQTKNANANESSNAAKTDVIDAVNNLPTNDLSLKYSLLQDADKMSEVNPTAPLAGDTRNFISAHAEKTIDDLAKKNKNIPAEATNQAKTAFDRLATAGLPIAPPKADDLTPVTDGDKHIQQMMSLIVGEYRNFSREVQGRLSVLRDPATPLDAIKKVANKLQLDANQELACLSDANFDDKYATLLGCPQNVNSATSDTQPSAPPSAVGACTDPGPHSLRCQLLEFAHDVQPLHERIEEALPSASALMDTLHAAAQDVAYQACVYQAFSDSGVNSIRSGLVAPLNSVVNDGFVFGYQYPNASQKREGPFADPTSVTMTLLRDKVSPFTSTNGASNMLEYTISSFSCSGDPEDIVTNGSSYIKLQDFFSDKLAKPAKVAAGTTATVPAPTTQLYMRNPNKPVLNGKTTSTTAGQGSDSAGGNGTAAQKSTTSDAATTQVLVQPWIFGKPRLVLSGGVGTALLSKQEFQRSMSINGATTETVIGLKTNTKVRTTPMLYGHAYIRWLARRHDPDAWYATFGVTANSDNKGTDPEFLFGLSRSFVQQRFFVTAGAYLGERQKLDGGLFVNEVIPSTFTTDLPVTKSYHTGFSFGISYRFASTKTTQDAKQPSTPSTKKGN